jgi:hypothetical protein
MKRPEEVKLSQEEGEALIERVKANRLSEADQRVLVKLIQLYFWLTFALRETKISLGRLKTALFGKSSKQPRSKEDDEGGDPEGGAGDNDSALANQRPANRSEGGEPKQRRQGHGRRSAESYSGAERVVCRHDTLAPGQRCPLCGRGRLYQLPSGVEIRVDGNALLSAVRYELEKLRCSGCGEVFTAELPAEAGTEKYSDQARAVLALSRYYLGLPFYRLEAFQQLVGVPVADATQWDQVERLADSVYPVFEQLKYLGAQGELIYQDDTRVRVLELIQANRQAQAAAAQGLGEAPERTGMYTTGLVIDSGERRICLYLSGRQHAGENLDELLKQRDPALPAPMVMSDALAANGIDAEAIRVHCLAHGQRYFSDIETVFPQQCARVLQDFKQVFEHDAHTREQAMTPQARLAYHQQHSEPILVKLKDWLEQQRRDRDVEPNSSLGKALAYLLGHWRELTQFLRIPGAPIDNNIVERALKLVIRQRNNSLFYASEHSAYIASALTSLIATCIDAGVNALDYLVTLQRQRSAVFQDPSAWLPWNYREPIAV